MGGVLLLLLLLVVVGGGDFGSWSFMEVNWGEFGGVSASTLEGGISGSEGGGYLREGHWRGGGYSGYFKRGSVGTLREGGDTLGKYILICIEDFSFKNIRSFFITWTASASEGFPSCFFFFFFFLGGGVFCRNGI